MRKVYQRSKKLLITLITTLIACQIWAADIYVVNSESRTLSHINTETGTVNNLFCQLGLTPNGFDLDENHIYVALSGDNAIQVIARQSGTHLRYIPVAPSANPWDCLKVGDYLYVSGLITGKVYKISLQSGSVVAAVDTGICPEGLAFANGKLYVTNAGNYQDGYTNSSVAVIDLASFSLQSSIPVWLNPQNAIRVGDKIHVACTGNWVDQFGKVYVIDSLTDTVESIIPLGGNLGGMWHSPSGKVYVGDGMNSGVYAYDAQSYSIHYSSANPLSPGGMNISGNSAFIAVLDASWGSNGTVRIRQHDYSPLAQYTVGLAPTEMMIYDGNVAVEEALSALPAIRCYPNPLVNGKELHFEGKELSNARLSIFNLRGQKVFSQNLISNRSTIHIPNHSSGLYFYRIESKEGVSHGKLLIQDR